MIQTASYLGIFPVKKFPGKGFPKMTKAKAQPQPTEVERDAPVLAGRKIPNAGKSTQNQGF